MKMPPQQVSLRDLTVDDAARLLAKRAAIVRRLPAEKTAAQPEWLKNMLSPQTTGPGVLGNPYARQALLGAGIGGTLGGLSSMFRSKKKRQPLRSALLGALAGGAAGAGVAHLRHPNSYATPAGPVETGTKQVEETLKGVDLAPDPGEFAAIASPSKPAEPVPSVGETLTGDTAKGVGTASLYQAARQSGRSTIDTERRGQGMRALRETILPGGSSPAQQAQMIQHSGEGGLRLGDLSDADKNVYRALTEPNTADSVQRQLRSGKRIITIREFRATKGVQRALPHTALTRMTREQAQKFLDRGLHSYSQNVGSAMAGKDLPNPGFASAGHTRGGRPTMARPLRPRWVPGGQMKVPMKGRFGWGRGIPQTAAAFSLPFLLRSMQGFPSQTGAGKAQMAIPQIDDILGGTGLTPEHRQALETLRRRAAATAAR